MVSVICSFNPLPEWLQELLVNISDLDQLVQASRINDVLEHLTSSANHSDCSINKNDHKSGYTFPFSRLHLPKYKTYNFFSKFILKKGGGKGSSYNWSGSLYYGKYITSGIHTSIFLLIFVLNENGVDLIKRVGIKTSKCHIVILGVLCLCSIIWVSSLWNMIKLYSL